MPDLDPTAASGLPRHVAIIMDGNGRWATARGLGRLEGHRRGAEATRRVIEAAGDMGISYVTLFAFSSENWQRPMSEVGGLMDLLRFYLKKETGELHKNRVRLRVIGDRTRLPVDIASLIEQVEDVTRDNTKMTVVIALSYGGRQDIVEAARRLAAEVHDGKRAPDDIDDAAFASALSTVGLPDPDLLIRTSGEQRISNFLLWQMAYTEMYFTDVYWPDFGADHLRAALDEYARRQRRFGALVTDTAAVPA